MVIEDKRADLYLIKQLHLDKQQTKKKWSQLVLFKQGSLRYQMQMMCFNYRKFDCQINETRSKKISG